MIKDFKQYLNESNFIGKKVYINDNLKKYIVQNMWSKGMLLLIGEEFIPTSYDPNYKGGSYNYSDWKIPEDCLTEIKPIEKYEDDNIQWF
jgi:tRNA-binding EMAP/Myf-like protein